MKKILFTALSLMVFASFFSCATMDTKQGQGTAVGAGVGAGAGALLGQAIGRNTQATLIGAGIGAVVGGLAGNQIGRYMDQQEQDLRNAVAASESASISREQDNLRATFKGEAYFDHDSSSLKPGAYTELQRISDVLKNYPQTTIEIGGHTDASGPEDYNQRLSEKRAQAVQNALIQNGISPQRMLAVGYGETRPISSDPAMNRRVEVIIVPIRQG